jgi:hypothetical protein
MPVETMTSTGASACVMRIRPQAGGRRGICRSCSKRVRQVEFSPTVEADLVRAAFDREHTAEVTVAASKHKLENVQQEFHKSCARWRRSQLPLASSQSSRERTLARARAIAQSAAP